MAKKNSAKSNGTSSSHDDTSGESISGYFRRIFDENPKWLDTRSNEQLFSRWLADHPGDNEVPERVRHNLSNIKSVLRKLSRRKVNKQKKEGQPALTNSAPVEAPRRAVKGLDTLEEHIDECLSLAKTLDREGLTNVIGLLRRARNEVVWKMGETAHK